MADPLAISAGINQGQAQIFRGGLTPEQGLEYNLGRKQAQDAADAAAQKQRQKQKDDALKTIDDVALGGWVGNLPELESQKEFLINKLADNYIKNPNYDPTTDREMRLATSQLKANVLANKGKEDWIKSTVPFRQKADDFEWSDDIRKVQQGSLNDYNNYLKEYGSAPYPTPKKELIDYEPMFKDLAKGLGTKATTIEAPLAEGGTKVVGSKRVPMSLQQEGIADLVDAGINGRNPKAVKFVEDIKSKLSNDAHFQVAPPEKQAKMIMDEAKKEGERKLQKYLDTEYSETLQGQGQGKGMTLNFGGGSSATDKSYFELTPAFTEITLPSGKKEKKQTSLNITYGVPGATALPEQSFFGDKGEEIVGKPTGSLINRGSKEKPDLYIEINAKVPEEYDTTGQVVNTNKTIKKIVSISGNPKNKSKFEHEYSVSEHGYKSIDDLYKALVESKKGGEKKKPTEDDPLGIR